MDAFGTVAGAVERENDALPPILNIGKPSSQGPVSAMFARAAAYGAQDGPF
jgi:hypothetical protein